MELKTKKNAKHFIYEKIGAALDEIQKELGLLDANYTMADLEDAEEAAQTLAKILAKHTK